MNGLTAVGSQEFSSLAVRFLTTLSQIYKSCSESSISCQYFRAMWNVTSISVLNFYSSALLEKHISFTPQRPCSSYKYFNSPTPFLRVYQQHFPFLPFGLTDSHSMTCCSRKNRQSLPSSEDKFFYIFIGIKWWNTTWADTLMNI